MLARSHVGWGFAVSLLLHVTGIAALTLALPRLNVHPGVIRRVELAIVHEAPPQAAALTAPLPAAVPADVSVEVSVEPAAASSAPIPPLRAAETMAAEPAASERSVVAAADASVMPAKPVTSAPKREQRKAAPKPVAAPEPKLQSGAHPDPRSDGSALERVLRQIAATTELTQDERRRAMLVVLRTWEDPSGKRSADELIDALLKNVRAARTASPPESPAKR